jgi:peptidyl-prolyl cis-trans isomerase B (cyclophilin B)
LDGALVLSAGTDGTDGPTDAAGAIADGSTALRAERQGFSPAAQLAANDSYPLFAALGDLVKTGSTGTNVMDLNILLGRKVKQHQRGRYTGHMSKQYAAPPALSIDPNKSYTATFVTSRGDIVCDLFPKDAPNTVNNFVFLARDGFYDNTTFHRVIADFMIQGGDPTGTGRGGPGYRFDDELKNNPRKHQVGSLSMANAGPNTNGSQFFITHIATDWLNGKHTVFGQVRSGQDVVDSVKQGDTLKSVKIEEA